MRRLIALCLALTVFALQPAAAQTATSPALQRRSADVVAILRGEGGTPESLFTPAFLAQVPAAQLTQISRSIAAQYGRVTGVEAITPAGPGTARLRVGTERAILNLTLTLAPEPPNLISGLVIVNAEPRGDSLAAVIQEMRALPGQVSFAVADLGEAAPVIAAGLEPDRIVAIGSTFKLVILAELDRQVREGRRRWSDVVPIDRRSLPTGSLQTWPRGSPVTLHTLATLMISVSDNTATDMLIHILGRNEVEAMMTRIGMSAAARNRPMLTTLEFFALKAGPADLLPAWRAGDEAARRRLVDGPLGAVRAEQIDVARLTGRPNAIDAAEWFASSADLVRVMDWLRRHGDDATRAILAISPGAAPHFAADFAYLGFKGGSETGVFSLTYLLRTRAGRWRVVTGTWNNPAAPVEDQRFGMLMQRALGLSR